MANGCVTIPTVVHMIQPSLRAGSRTDAEWTAMVNAQMKVLNDSFSGATGGVRTRRSASTSTSIDFTENDAWYHVVPGKGERDMKKALYTGDSETLNVYAADIGGGLLGWAYFPQGYNNGRDYHRRRRHARRVDAGRDRRASTPSGDTLTHEVGHWLALHHTFQAGCSASNDFVADTPKEAIPQFDCPVGADTCTAPGEDPIHNFMDYSQDSCMYLFTAGQAKRMNDAWINFRAIP